MKQVYIMEWVFAWFPSHRGFRWWHWICIIEAWGERKCLVSSAGLFWEDSDVWSCSDSTLPICAVKRRRVERRQPRLRPPKQPICDVLAIICHPTAIITTNPAAQYLLQELQLGNFLLKVLMVSFQCTISDNDQKTTRFNYLSTFVALESVRDAINHLEISIMVDSVA